ncbi:hypothetical protein Bra5_PD00646 (plasmid) [Rhizobium phaseoli Brasil 5]|nr:hypothetical protein Bra5_PD00646 [Rhizobium phaseoli Brasil 5]
MAATAQWWFDSQQGDKVRLSFVPERRFHASPIVTLRAFASFRISAVLMTAQKNLPFRRVFPLEPSQAFEAAMSETCHKMALQETCH